MILYSKALTASSFRAEGVVDQDNSQVCFFVPFGEWEGKEAAAEQLAQPFCALIAYTWAGHPEQRLG